MSIYKYTHILWRDDTKFAPRLVNFINDEQNAFVKSDHLFVTSSKKLYMCIKHHFNVIFDDLQPSDNICSSLINKYSSISDWIFVHSLCSVPELFRIKMKYRKKIIWRSWGHDAVPPYTLHNNQILRNLIKLAVRYFWKRVIVSFAGVGISNRVDMIALTKTFGQIRLFVIPYPNIETLGFVKKLGNESECYSKSELSILVGHSGYQDDNHINVLKSLNAYRGEKMKIYIMLPYGDSSYISLVTKYVNDQKRDDYVLVNEFMPYDKYAAFLKSIDICVLDGVNSYALGCLELLIYFRKKLIINRSGVIKEALDIEKVPYLCTDTAFLEPFSIFKELPNYDISDVSMIPKSLEYYAEKFGEVLSQLSNSNTT